MKRLLTKDELTKLSSTDGIIELLCGIPNFKTDDYDELDYEIRDLIDYTMSIKLLSDSQINGNLRRSMDAGNLALINQRKLTALSLLYFGIKDENGKYVKYICPYTGKEYNLEEVRKELNKPYNSRELDKVLELEHIMPHSSGGGTVLFNCIPASREANSIAEKGNLHLLDWLSNPESSGYKYYENGGVERLSKLVNYMLSAYEISFEEYEESELEFNYDNADEIEEGIDNEEDSENNDRKVADNKKKIRETSIDGDIPFLNQLINQLEKEGYDIKDIRNRLVELEKNGIINNLKNYTNVQKTIEELFEKEDSKSYLTYSLNVDYIKLVNSIGTDEPEKIKEILTKRFEQIKQLTEQNGKSIKDYFISLRDIQEIDLLYQDNVSERDIENFINNIKLGYNGKIDVFIEMLSENEYTEYENGVPNKNNIFGQKNKVKFKGYENIDGLNTSQFWRVNSKKIKEKVETQIKELKSKERLTDEEQRKLEKLQKAEKVIDCYEVTTNLDKRIDCYVEMLSENEYTGYENGNPNRNNIFGQKNKVQFKGYENIDGLNTSQFWRVNSKKIKERVETQIKDLKSKERLTDEEQIKLEKLQKAEKAINKYEFTCNLDKRIDCYIEMLAEENYTGYENGIPNKNNIFGHRNGVAFKGYEDIDGLNTSQFWSMNSYKIKLRLEENIRNLISKENLNEEEKIKLNKLKKAEGAIDNYKFTININKRIDCYIEMLAEDKYTGYVNGVPDSNNIFRRDNKLKFKKFENINGLNIGQFWSHHSYEINARIKEQIEELEVIDKANLTEREKTKLKQLKKAKRAIDCYEFSVQGDLDKRIDCYIKMLSEDKYIGYEKLKDGKTVPNKNNIFGQKNEIQFKGYENIEGLNTSYFWQHNSDKIKLRILEQIKVLSTKESLTKDEQKKLEKLKKAEEVIDCYEFRTILDRRIDCYIEMLSEDQYTGYEKGISDKNNIFGYRNDIAFKGYEKIDGVNTSHFWSSNSDKIKERIEEEIQELITKENLIEKEKTKFVKLQKAKNAIDCFEFSIQGNIDRRIDCYIEMLTEDKYTAYNNGKPNINNIFKTKNEVQFKGYEKIKGLNTSGFWSKNSIKIISQLFYNKDDKGNKLEKDYSGPEYDKARKAILEYAKVENIDEYIDKIKSEKKKNTLIKLRENTSELTMSDVEKVGRMVRGVLDKDKEIA